MKRIKMLFIILSLFLVFFITACTVPEKAVIKPFYKDVENVALNIEIEQEMSVAGEEIESEGESSMIMQILSSNEENTKISCTVTEYNIESDVGKDKEISFYENINNLIIDFGLDTNGNITIDRINDVANETGLTENDVKSSLEQLFGLILKGFPENEIEIKTFWFSEFSVPQPMQGSPDAKKVYNIRYKFDKIDNNNEIADIQINGNVSIEGDNISISKGTISGLIMFNVKKGFAERLNVTEIYDINFDKDKLSTTDIDLSSVSIEQHIVIDSEIPDKE